MVVDDEPLARKVLKNYIEKLPSLNLVKECGDAMEAAAYLHAHDVDLLFLDIKMPEMTGMEFLDTLETPPKVIITTAFSEYALQGYEYAVMDYLLKPIPFERFLKAVNKALKAEPSAMEGRKDSFAAAPPEFLFLKADKAEHKVKLSDICCVEAWRNYVKVHLDDEVLMVSETMTAMEASLPGEAFIRIHKSFMVAIDKIERVQGNKVQLPTMTVPIGKYYKKDVQNLMDSHRLRGEE
jgi:DNA-binding LytR/AlgR family response regulator